MAYFNANMGGYNVGSPQFNNMQFVQYTAPYMVHGYTAPADNGNDFPIKGIGIGLLVAGLLSQFAGNNNDGDTSASGDLHEGDAVTTTTGNTHSDAIDYTNGGNTAAIPGGVTSGGGGLSASELEDIMSGSNTDDDESDEDGENDGNASGDYEGLSPGGKLLPHAMVVGPGLANRYLKGGDRLDDSIANGQRTKLKIAADDVTKGLAKNAKVHFREASTAAEKLVNRSKKLETKFADLRMKVMGQYDDIYRAAPASEIPKLEKGAEKAINHLNTIEETLKSSKKQAKKIQDATEAIQSQYEALKKGGDGAKKALQTIEEQKKLISNAMETLEDNKELIEDTYTKANKAFKKLGYSKANLRIYQETMETIAGDTSKIGKHVSNITKGLNKSDDLLRNLATNYADEAVDMMRTVPGAAKHVLKGAARLGLRALPVVGGAILAGDALIKGDYAKALAEAVGAFVFPVGIATTIYDIVRGDGNLTEDAFTFASWAGKGLSKGFDKFSKSADKLMGYEPKTT